MDNFITWMKLACGALAGILSFAFGGLDMLFSVLLVCILIDYVTGVLAALYEKRLNSASKSFELNKIRGKGFK